MNHIFLLFIVQRNKRVVFGFSCVDEKFAPGRKTTRGNANIQSKNPCFLRVFCGKFTLPLRRTHFKNVGQIAGTLILRGNKLENSDYFICRILIFRAFP